MSFFSSRRFVLGFYVHAAGFGMGVVGGGREGGREAVGMLAVFGRWAGEGGEGVVVYLNC